MNSFLLPKVGRFAPRLLTVVLAAAGALSLRAQPVTSVQLAAPAKGAAAVAALGAHLPTVAKAYGLEAQQLVTLFQTQPSLGVDTRGVLLFACNATVPAKTAGSDTLVAGSAVTTLAAGGSVDAFQLHSFPGASRVIYLDFTGHTTSGTSWNNGGSIVSQPFDLDGSPSTFNSTERATIQAIWSRVAEDYAPFAIDVTTQDPGLESLRKSSSTDTAYGIRVVISPTNWYNTNAGGTAYVGSFSWDSDTPCFAFTNELLNSDKFIADAVAHEVGHTLGLYHDGGSGTEYYAGQGNWAPIMGVGYYAAVTQFSKGEYPGATNTQDDFAVMSGYAPLATDDHGNTLNTATALVGPNIADGGTIETRTDVDVFRFDTGAGAISFSIKSPAADSDLDIKAELLDANGQVLQSSDPATLDASISAVVAQGTYYLRVSGVGAGDPNTTGYTDYGSVGNYLITGTTVYTAAASKQAPTAVASASTTSGLAALTVAFNGQASTDSDGSIVSYRWDFGNGATSTAVNPTYIYATAGAFIATLTVTDNDGLSSSASVPITVLASQNQLPVAIATSSVSSGVAPLAVTFSSSGSYDPDGSLVSYLWDFGDGTTSTSPSPSKTFSTAGTFTVRLTVTDNGGATASATLTISVKRSRKR